MTKDKFLSTHQEIADELSQYHKEQFRAPLIDYTGAHDCKIEFEHNKLLNELLINNKQVKETSTTEINRLIKTLKPTKSAGYDLVSNFMIRKLSLSYIECLTNCFNQWLSEGRYPNE